MRVDQVVPSLCDRPFGVHEQRHPAAVASPQADENLGQLFEIAVPQIGHRPGESGETFETSDVTLPDVGDEQIFVGRDVEGLDDKAGAAELFGPRRPLDMIRSTVSLAMSGCSTTISSCTVKTIG
jgi:hypothetical protein